MKFKISKFINPLYEILLIVLCVLIAAWAVPMLFGKNYFAGFVPVAAAFIIMFLSHRFRGESFRDLGFRFDNLWQSFRFLFPLMLFFSLLLILLGWVLGSLRIGLIPPNWTMLEIYLGLFVWGLIQQYPLQGFMNRRSQLIWGKGAASIIFVASIFSLLHLPNLWLMLATFGGGLLWAWAYQRVPNLFVLAFSHSFMSVILVLTMPYSALHGMRVGYGYFR